ncbi:hypothetical protein SDC9_206977 [bioreactor metagenome]|uniref:Uncharacterized protein n=1 Tax=bioreactor metagenome TaxID=1076179 RepID=A0A645J747_9ZZZZ
MIGIHAGFLSLPGNKNNIQFVGCLIDDFISIEARIGHPAFINIKIAAILTRHNGNHTGTGFKDFAETLLRHP